MKYLLLILTVVLFSSCLTKRQWERRYPPIEQTDTLRIIDTVEIDVPVEIEMPKDTVRLTDTIYIEDAPQTLIDTLRTEFAESVCGWRDGVMLHELYHREAIIRDTVRVPMFNETIIITTDKLHPVRYVTGWHKFASGFTIFIGTLILALLVFRLVR